MENQNSLKTKGFQGFFVMKKARKLNTTGSFCELHSSGEPCGNYSNTILPVGEGFGFLIYV